MDDRLITIEDCKQALINKQKLENNEIQLEDLTLEEIEDINYLYELEIAKKKSDIEHLREEALQKRKKLGLD